MLQQAGIAELGPFLKNFRMWKLERYRKCWVAAQTYWLAERMLRVTNDQQLAQFMELNTVRLDQYGLPIIVNALGNINVEVKVDEGPDTETVMGDMFDLLIALSQNNVPVPPQVIIEASNLPLSEKNKLQTMMAQPDPVKQAATQAADRQGAIRRTIECRQMAATNRPRPCSTSPRLAPKVCQSAGAAEVAARSRPAIG